MKRALVPLLVVVPVGAEAGGFYVPEIGARASGMAGAATAQNRDASAVVHNPAAMAGQKGTKVDLGALLAFPSITYFRRPVDDPNTGEPITFDAVENVGPPALVPFLGAQSDAIGHGLYVGLAVHAPFGAALEYPASGSQRHVVTEVELRTIFVGPALAFAITDELSIGATLDYVYSDLTLHQRNALQFVTGDPEVFPDPSPEVEGDTAISVKDPFSLTSRLGLLFHTPLYAIGLSVRLPANLHMTGSALVENPTITALLDDQGAELQPAGRREDEVALEIPLPLIVSLGTTLRPLAWLTVALDVSWQRWSTFETLTVDFQNEHELLPTPGAFLYDVTTENRWRDSFSVRLGFEAQPFESLPLQLRLGGLLDQSPIDDRHFDLLAPDSDKLGISGGVGYSFSITDDIALDVDAMFMHLFLRERNVAPSETTVAGTDVPIPGTDKTILNKSAPSFYYGVTRSRIELVYVGLGLRL